MTDNLDDTAEFSPFDDGNRYPEYFGRYRVTRSCGQNCLADIFEGYDELLERPVQIRCRPRSDLADSTLLLRQSRLWAKLEHPGFLPVYDAGEADRSFFLVSKLCNGDVLRDWMYKHQADATQTATLIEDLAYALAFAHDNGLIHGDLKPSNVFLEHERAVLSSPFPPSDESEWTAIVGGLEYMAPELMKSDSTVPCAKSDVFSLGVVMYELLTGKRPWNPSSVVELVRCIHEEQPPPPRRLNRKVPSALNGICMQALRKDPAKRPTAIEIAKRLEEFVHRPRWRPAWL